MAADAGAGAADAPTAAPGAVFAADGLSPHALQILTTEHWSLLSARSLGYTEAMSRVSMFIAALSGAVVALALVSQATDFGNGFTAFALVLLPVVFFLGLVTILRLAQINHEDAIWVQGMNRLRHAYLEIAPDLEPYFVTSRYDDEAGVLMSAMVGRRLPMPIQGFVAVPGVVAVLDSVVAAAIAAIASLAADLGTGPALAIAAVAFGTTMLAFIAFAVLWVVGARESFVVRFRSPAPS
jgi:hypothetical protein